MDRKLNNKGCGLQVDWRRMWQRDAPPVFLVGKVQIELLQYLVGENVCFASLGDSNVPILWGGSHVINITVESRSLLHCVRDRLLRHVIGSRSVM